MTTVVQLRQGAPTQLASLEQGWMSVWWMRDLLEAEQKNEFHLIYEGHPVAYKWDLGHLPVWVKASREPGGLRISVFPGYEAGYMPVDQAGVWLVLPEDVTTPAVPGPVLPVREGAVVFYSHEGVPLVAQGVAYVVEVGEEDLAALRELARDVLEKNLTRPGETP